VTKQADVFGKGIRNKQRVKLMDAELTSSRMSAGEESSTNGNLMVGSKPLRHFANAKMIRN